MNLFSFKKNTSPDGNQSNLAELALKTIHDGVIITDKNGAIQFINPAAVMMTDCGSAKQVQGLDYGLVLKLESKEGRELSDAENPLVQAMNTNQPLESFQGRLITKVANKHTPIAISVLPADGFSGNRLITFRDITKELEEEGAQTEFISTASHEMRTPIASIEGYLSLTLNSQTATIDERARGYLEAAHAASQHLGKLFRDLLDTTKLDDGHIRPHFVPVEMVELIHSITNDYLERAKAAKLTFKFGSDQPISLGETKRLDQVVYSSVDVNFMREIMDNLIENALKYTPEGGSIYVNVRGDGDRALINVTDTGIGISAEDLSHIFQKFYRSDNSDTRTIGGTGLGLYIVKQRAEAMGGRVWAESGFGEGSTFFVSLPRISADEYNKRMIVFQNQQAMAQAQQPAPAPAAAPTPTLAPTPVLNPNSAPAPAPTLAPAPAAPISVSAPAPAAPTPVNAASPPPPVAQATLPPQQQIILTPKGETNE